MISKDVLTRCFISQASINLTYHFTMLDHFLRIFTVLNISIFVNTKYYTG